MSVATSEVVKHQSLVAKTMAGPFTFHITNLTGGDIRFLSDLTALFCDPKHQHLLEAIRAGRMGIFRDPQSHKCIVSDLYTPPLVLARQSQKN